MGYRLDEFAPGEIYHLYTRGVEQRTIFLDDIDRKRFLALLSYYLPKQAPPAYSVAKKLGLLNKNQEKIREGEGLIDLLVFCLMNNHIHLLVKENLEHGVSTYMQRLLNSYAHYFNRRYERNGPLFSGPFKAVNVGSDEQLLHVSRYAHLNPYAAHMTEDPFRYKWSSLREYVGYRSKYDICHTNLIKSLMEPADYKTFIKDQEGFARDLANLRHLLIE